PQVGVVAVLAVEGHTGVVRPEYALDDGCTDLSCIGRPILSVETGRTERLRVVASQDELAVEGLPTKTHLGYGRPSGIAVFLAAHRGRELELVRAWNTPLTTRDRNACLREQGIDVAVPVEGIRIGASQPLLIVSIHRPGAGICHPTIGIRASG